MIVSAHQPNYMPWLGFFHKMKKADRFILADDVQFTKHGYTNRVQIKTASGPSWITVPVLTTGKGPQKIRDVRIDVSQNWQKKQIKTFLHHYKYAPYFEYYFDSFRQNLEKEWKFLLDLNCQLIEYFRRELSIETPLHFSSHFEVPEETTERIVSLVTKVGGTVYLSGESGKKYLNALIFENAGVILKFDSFSHPRYRQVYGNFDPGLSIIDLLFNEGPGAAGYF